MRKPLLLVVLLVALAGLGWTYWQNPGQFMENMSITELFSSSSNGANHPTGSKISLTAVDQRFPNVLKSRPDHMRDVLHSAYRLTPDNRLLLAVGEVHSFFSGEAPEKAAATWAGQHWLIEYKDRKIGTLPELPDFPDFIQLLSQWAQQLETQYPLNLTSRPGVEWEQGLTKKLDRVLVPNVVSALKEMDALWRQGQHDSKLLQLGARGLALITLQATDRMEIMDPLPAKALAMLSIARGLTPHNLNREECLLAEAMDYAAHAVRLSRKLIPSDPLRHFVNRNDRLLQALAKSKKAGRLADYLWLLRLSRRENMQDWHLWLKTAFGDDPISLPLLKSGLDYKSFFTSRNFTREVRHIVLLELDREEKGPAAKPSRDQAVNTFLAHNTYYQVLNALLDLGNPTIVDTMEHMESGLEVLEKKYQGPFLKANTYKSYFNAYFYSTLYIEGLYYLDSLSSLSATEEFQSQLKGKAEVMLTRVKSILSLLKDRLFALRDTGEVVHASLLDSVGFSRDEDSRIGEFVLWYNHLAESEFGTGNVQVLADDIINIKRFGAFPLYRTFKEAKRYFKFTDPAWFITLKRIAWRMDTRPHHRQLMGNMAQRYLHDLALSEKLFGSLAQVSPSHYDGNIARYAQYKNDKKMMLAMLKDSSVQTEFRSNIIGYLKKRDDIKPKFISRQYEKLIRANPDDWDTSYDYAWFLKQNKQYGKARKVMRQWLDREVPTPGLEHTVSQNLIATTFKEEGRYEEGLKATPKSNKGSSLVLRGEFLEKLGRVKEAEKVFRILKNRYPSSFTSGLSLVKFLWRQGRYPEAADAVLKSNYYISQHLWDHKFGHAFRNVFKDKSKAETLKALSYFVQAKVSFNNLNHIPRLLMWEDQYEKAFAVADRIVRNQQNKTYIGIHYYSDYKKWKGKKAALAWARKMIPPEKRDASSQYIYRAGQYELLWSLIEKPEIEYAWLMRAAASLQYKDLSKKDRKELNDYYRKAGGAWDLAGKYLLGMVSKKQFIQACKPAFTRGVYAFYLGLKAETEGNLKEASEWYRVSMETGWHQVAEYHWSVAKLENWVDQKRFLSQLDPDKI